MSETNPVYVGLLGRLMGPPAVVWALTSNDSSWLAWVNNVGLGAVPCYRHALLQTSVKSAVVWALFYALGNADVRVPHMVEGFQAIQRTEMPSTRKTRAWGMAILYGATAGVFYAALQTVSQGKCTQGAARAALGCWLVGVTLLVQ